MTVSKDDIVQRLVDLESRAAHYERMAEDLSEVLAQQSTMIEKMMMQIRRLADRLDGSAEGWGASPQDSKPPPHY